MSPGGLLAEPWTYLVLGLVLLGVEALAPGVFALWFGLAALATGLVLFAAPALPVGVILVLFAALAAGSVLAGRALGGRGAGADRLHRRGNALVGRVFTLGEPILGGAGLIRVDDTVWRVTGPDMDAGARVRVVGLDGTLLRVESATPG